MSDRLPEAVGNWMPTSEDAFGETGRKGDAGEIIIYRLLEELGFEVIHYPSDQTRQLRGEDFVVRRNGKEFGIDGKCNLNGPDHKFHNTVCVDKGLKTTNAVFYIHVNEQDPDDYIIYKVKDMRPLLDNYRLIRNRSGSGGFYSVPRQVASSL
jgi:hypothetical protein